MLILDRRNQESYASGKTVIGCYYPNGIFKESDTSRGISYILDHLLFENLKSAVDDNGLGCVRGYTNYGYSGFTVLCASGKAQENIKTLSATLLETELCFDFIVPWVEDQKRLAHKRRRTTKDLYYRQRLPQNPLGQPLPATLNCVPEIEALDAWRKRFVMSDNLVFIVNGSSSVQISEGNHIPRNSLPRFTPSELTPPKSIPWKYCNMVVAIPCALIDTNALAGEAMCEILRRRLAACVRKAGGRLISAMLYPDFIPELRIHLQIPKENIDVIRSGIEHLLQSEILFADWEISQACADIQKFYAMIRDDEEEWNKFVGYNLLSGNRYDIELLLNDSVYKKRISATSVAEALAALQNNISFTVFITSAN